MTAGTKNGTVAIAGTTPVEMAYALAQYCQRELLMSFTWVRSGGFQVEPVTQAASIDGSTCHTSSQY